MIKKNNKTCVCCQKKYTFCLSCSDFDSFPRWMAIYHDENCKKICNTTSKYRFKHITKEQARKILDECDLSNRESFNKTIQKDLDEIYINDVKDVTNVIEEKIVSEIKEPVKTIEIKEEIIEPETIVETKVIAEENTVRTKKRKNYKTTKVENTDNE